MMLSKLRRLPDVLPSPTSRVRFAVLASVLFAAFAFAGAAIAANIYWASTLSPGGYASTGGWNNRTYNWACRDDGTGNTGRRRSRSSSRPTLRTIRRTSRGSLIVDVRLGSMPVWTSRDTSSAAAGTRARSHSRSSARPTSETRRRWRCVTDESDDACSLLSRYPRAIWVTALSLLQTFSVTYIYSRTATATSTRAGIRRLRIPISFRVSDVGLADDLE